jgi:class 3 adenylate cyclase
VPVDRATSLDVLLALVGPAVSGDEVASRLTLAGKRTRPDALLRTLLGLEASGHVQVTRGNRYVFGLTARGRDAVSELGPGTATPATLLMVDLAGFVPFTVANGDDAARHMADLLHLVVHHELAACGGRVVKTMGDGVLALAPVDADAIGAVAEIALRMAAPDAGSWRLRAAVHVGAPLCVRGDVYGHDVNVVARLAELARPDEIVASAPGASDAELVSLRGVDAPVAIVRLALVGS